MIGLLHMEIFVHLTSWCLQCNTAVPKTMFLMDILLVHMFCWFARKLVRHCGCVCCCLGKGRMWHFCL